MDIIDRLNKLLNDTTAHAMGSVDMTQGPYGSNIMGMRYIKKKKKVKGGAEYPVHEAAGKNKIISGAKNVAEEIMDDLPYKAKEYFGGYPEDVVGRDMAKVFYNNLYKHLGKLIREQIKK